MPRFPSESDSTLHNSANHDAGKEESNAINDTHVHPKVEVLPQPNRSKKDLAFRLIHRLLLNCLLCAILILLFWSNQRTLTRHRKHIFNAANIGISLVISLNIVSALKFMASEMKGKIMNARTYTIKELELLDNLESYQHLLWLAFAWRKKLVPLVCIIGWIILGMAAQICVALTGLSIEMNEHTPTVKEGLVNITDLSKFYVSENRNGRPSVGTLGNEEYVAFGYGEGVGILQSDVDRGARAIDDAFTDLSVFQNPKGDWTYRYRDWSILGSNATFAVNTERTASVTANCSQYNIVEEQLTDGAFTVDLRDQGGNWTVDWLAGRVGHGLTVHVTGIESETRGARIWVFQFPPAGKKANSTYLDCTVQISPVENAVIPEHNLDDRVAAIAAATSASTGIFYTLETNDTRVQHARAFQLNTYNNGSYLGKDGLTENIMAYYLGLRGAICLANMDILNPNLKRLMNGFQVWQGSQVVVTWAYVGLTVGLLIAGHVVCAIVAFILYDWDVSKSFASVRLSRCLVSSERDP